MKWIGQARKSPLDPKPSMVPAAGTIFIGVLLAAAFSSGCTRSAASSAVADVCEMKHGSFVAVEGFLQLPNFLTAETNSHTGITMYELSLAAQSDGNSPVITTQITGTSENEANRIADLPVDGYTQRDLKVFTANGEAVGPNDRVRISGELQKERIKGGQPCILKSEKIEKQ